MRRKITGNWFSTGLMAMCGFDSDYESRKVKRTDLGNGIEVDTAWTDDFGYETAVIDVNGTFPVERYTNKRNAIKGHNKWARTIKNGSKVPYLGTGDGIIADSEIVVEGRKEL